MFPILSVLVIFLVAVSGTPFNRGVVGGCVQMCDDNASCPDGYVCQHSGCSATCIKNVVTRAEHCGVIICSTWCEDGRVLDNNGCPTCTCL